LGPFIGEIRHFHNDKIIGLTNSLDIGIKYAKGQFIIRLDVDDYVYMEFLNILAQCALSQQNHGIDAIAYDYVVFICCLRSKRLERACNFDF